MLSLPTRWVGSGVTNQKKPAANKLAATQTCSPPGCRRILCRVPDAEQVVELVPGAAGSIPATCRHRLVQRCRAFCVPAHSVLFRDFSFMALSAVCLVSAWHEIMGFHFTFVHAIASGFLLYTKPSQQRNKKHCCCLMGIRTPMPPAYRNPFVPVPADSQGLPVFQCCPISSASSSSLAERQKTTFSAGFPLSVVIHNPVFQNPGKTTVSTLQGLLP